MFYTDYSLTLTRQRTTHIITLIVGIGVSNKLTLPPNSGVYSCYSGGGALAHPRRYEGVKNCPGEIRHIDMILGMR